MPGAVSVPELALRIVAHVREQGLSPGTRLPERRLADLLEVSRTPVAAALRLLEAQDVVVASERGGFEVGHADPAVDEEALGLIPDDDEVTYLALARDLTSGVLPPRVTENELMRRYPVGRPLLVRVLVRAAAEGWVERLPGHGWRFTPLLTSDETFAAIYRYRILVEPAALLEPTFELDRKAVEAARDRELALFGRPVETLSPAEVFGSGSEFHEVLVRCSRNQIMINSLEQVNRLRRLTEYSATPASERWAQRCQEHAGIADLLLAGDREGAAVALRAHLEAADRAKVVHTS